MKKVVLGISLCIFSLYGVELDLQPSAKITIGVDSFTTIALPFDIKHIEKAPFVSNEKVTEEVPVQEVTTAANEIDPKALENAESLPQPNAANLSPVVNSNISMKYTKRLITILPKKTGSTELVIYGYDKYPVIIKLDIQKKAARNQFVFNSQYEGVENKENVKDFEATQHEKVISKLLKYTFNYMVPEGYKKVSIKKSFRKDGVSFNLTQKVIGDDYEINEWVIQNNKSNPIKLNEESFYNNGIYAVSLLDDVLSPREITKMYIVKAVNRK
ncbi:type-F conjugative transfer system secretin TraK [Aquamicrobium sp.]|uniref:TraK domain-containing protein n=1 Tax=Aquamicrobium sp. TaxID=1872579 RepID=UPI00258FAAC6|nr:type-F conjugative transfer system secretin TraK [Aquamicrobium sp.]MCK9550947.1 type-F conjugative transfer system secretin TraK [Aquamicrobium sp.]